MSIACIDLFQISQSELLCTLSPASVLVWCSCSACSAYGPRWWGTLKTWPLTWRRSWRRLAGSARSSWRTSSTMTSQTRRHSVASHSPTARQKSSVLPRWRWRWLTERRNRRGICPTETSGHIETRALTPFIRLKPTTTESNLRVKCMRETTLKAYLWKDLSCGLKWRTLI